MKAKMRHMPKIFNRSSAHRNFAYNFSPFSGFQVLYRIKGYIVSKEKYVINRKNDFDPIKYYYLSMTFQNSGSIKARQLKFGMQTLVMLFFKIKPV